MKIVLINTSEVTGGAAVAANRLMKALRKAGVEASMLVRDKKTDDPHVFSVNTSYLKRKINLIRFTWERIVIFLCNFLSKKNLFQVSIANTGTDISKHPLVQEADIIHLHWINQGFLSLSDLQKLIETGKPIVWTLHDLWPLTAICHYPGECEKYTSDCHQCPKMKRNPFYDIATSTFEKKKRMGLSTITFVGCSQWILEKAKKGVLLNSARSISIPNPIDTTTFQWRDRQTARKRFDLPSDKYLLLFAAAKVSDNRKGAVFLIEACERLKEVYQDRMEIVLMGNSSEELIRQFPFKVNTLGYISDQASMVSAYACADMFVIPSLEDNLPNTIMEAMACGTPCVGFHIGGIPEMIDHLKNGYVAAYKDTADLAKGIQWIIAHQESLRLREACIHKVQEYYQESVVIDKYLSLYHSLHSPISVDPHPTFSIITVTYNAEQWLERTILSVWAQSYPDIEYIVIDGASTDRTPEIIKRYSAGITYWVSEPDKGLYDAMNKGLRRATGDYVWFLNAGDTFYSPDTLRSVVASLKKAVSLPDVIYGETQIVDAFGNSLGRRRLRVPKQLTWKSFQRGMLVCHQSFAVKREIAPLYDTTYRLTADYDWCIQCLRQAKETHNTHLFLSKFLEEGMSSVNRKASLKERYVIMCKYYGRLMTTVWHIWFAIRFYFAKWVKGRI